MELLFIFLAGAQYLALGLLLYVWRQELTASRLLVLLFWTVLTQFSLYRLFQLLVKNAAI